MYNYFWWTLEVKNFLFFGYDIHSTGGLVATCFGLAAMSFLFEFLKLMQARFRQRELLLRSKQLRSICPTENSTLLGENAETIIVTIKDRVLLLINELFLWLSLTNLAYILMLIVMFYNGWFIISIIMGSTLGYFIFGQTFVKINIQNCRILRDTYCMQKCGDTGNNSERNEDGETTPALEHISCHIVTTETAVTVHATENS